jgi:glycosyltransferase involved in cell wall biosynthesis
MLVWLPYIQSGSGTDVFTDRLGQGLQTAGIDVITQPFPHRVQYTPWLLRRIRAPDAVDAIIANSWNAFAFRRPRTKLVVVEHHCLFDSAYHPYRSFAQSLFHEILIRRFERASFDAADFLVAVSDYTANATARAFPGVHPNVIHNGINTEFFCPEHEPITEQPPHRPFRLLFVGNLTKRKGADLLQPIMQRLGQDFQLSCTTGLRATKQFQHSTNIHPLGQLTPNALRQAYRDADALLFPSRLEGFGYAAVEAMACGTPVIATDCSALPEVIVHEKTGLLCPANDIDAFTAAAQKIAQHRALHLAMRRNARAHAATHFGLDQWISQYVSTLRGLGYADLTAAAGA